MKVNHKVMFRLLAVVAASAALPAYGAIIVPTTMGGSITFEAEARDSQAGTSTPTGDAQASGGSFVDGMDKSAAGGGNGDYIQFDFSNQPNPALTYQLSYRYRHNLGGAPTITSEVYSITAGPVFTLETTTSLPATGGWQNTPLFTATSGTFSLGLTDTGLRFESLDNTTANGIVHYDQFTLTAVPEPASFALIGLCATGLLVRRRRASATMR